MFITAVVGGICMKLNRLQIAVLAMTFSLLAGGVVSGRE